MAQRFGGIVVEPAKLRDYCLSDTHPRVRHKARVFRSRLGLTAEDSETLWQALSDAATNRQEELNWCLPTPMSLASAMCWISS